MTLKTGSIGSFAEFEGSIEEYSAELIKLHRPERQLPKLDILLMGTIVPAEPVETRQEYRNNRGE